MAGLTIYIDDNDLKKAQKGYSWTYAQKTTPKETKPQGKYNVVATDKAYMTTQQPKSFQEVVVNEPVYDKVAKAIFPAEPSNGIIRDEKGNMLGEQPIEPLYGFKDPVFNLAFLGAGLANGAMEGITSIGEKVVTNKPLWTAISANNIKNRIEDEGFVEGVLEHPIETTLDVAMLSPVAKSIYPYVNKGVKNIIPNIKFASNKIASGIDYIARKISPQYDLYRTIETTTPKWDSYPVIDIHGLYPRKNILYANNPLYDLMVNSKGNDSFFLITPQNVKIGKVNNGAWSSQLIGDTFYDSGNVEGKFVSYGEPWQEFISRGHDGTSALWEFPVAGRRKPNISATDFKGDKMPYSVEDAYKFISEQDALDSEMLKLYKKVKDAGINAELGDIYNLELNLNNKYKNYKRLKDNGTWIKNDIYHANQTVISNYDWNFNNFLSEPFWKYSFDPESRTLQKELFVPRWGYKQSGGEQENTDTHLWKRIHWGEVDKSPTGNPLWGDKYEINNFDKYDRKKYLELKKQIRKEYPNAIFHYTRSKDGDMYVDSFRVPYEKQEDVVLPKVESKWNTVVTLPNGQEERQMKELVPETITDYVGFYRATKNGIQNMINFTDPWTLPKWTMAFENASGGPYSNRYYQLQNEYFDNGGKDNPLEYILNKDFDEVKTTGELETLNIPNALWYNTTKGTFMVSDENGNLNYSDYNLTPNDHYSVTDNVKIYRPKKTAITTIDQNAVKRNKFIKEMNEVNRIANILKAGQNRTWNLQYQQGGPTHLQPWDEQRFRMWFNSLPERIRNSNDYDYRGWWLEKEILKVVIGQKMGLFRHNTMFVMEVTG